MKSRELVGLGLIVLVASASPSGAELEKAVPLPVWPREASTVTTISLGDLITKAIPTKEIMGWDHLQNSNVRWMTDGIEYVDGNANRLGYSRVRAGGVVTKILRQKWEELAWSVELSTEGNSKWGPTTLEIRPGVNSSQFKGKYICFGEGFSGCSFGIEALSGPRLKLTRQCTIGDGANTSVVMRAVTADGRRGTVVYSGSGGSGGYSNSVEISTLSPADYCSAYKDRGY